MAPLNHHIQIGGLTKRILSSAKPTHTQEHSRDFFEEGVAGNISMREIDASRRFVPSP